MFHPRTVSFTVAIEPHKVHESEIRHCIAEAIRAYTGFNTSVSLRQIDDSTLEINITQAPQYHDAKNEQGPYTNENV